MTSVHSPGGYSTIAAGSTDLDQRQLLVKTVAPAMKKLLQRWRVSDVEGSKLLSAEFENLRMEVDPGEFIRALPSELHEEAFFQNTLIQWAGASPGEALEWLATYAGRERFSHICDLAVTNWVRIDPVAALQWVLDQPQGGSQDHLLARLTIGFAEKHPVFAADFVTEMLPTAGAERQHALEGIGAVWAQSDPAASATWAWSLAETGARLETVGLVLYSWFDQDPGAVDAWVRRLPDPGERDLIRSRLVGWQIEKNPKDVPIILAEISDAALRQQMSLNLVHHWARDDFEPAAEWALKQASLPLRARLVTELAVIAGEKTDMLR